MRDVSIVTICDDISYCVKRENRYILAIAPTLSQTAKEKRSWSVAPHVMKMKSPNQMISIGFVLLSWYKEG